MLQINQEFECSSQMSKGHDDLHWSKKTKQQCLLFTNFLTFMKNIQFQFLKKQEVSFLIMGLQVNGTLSLFWFGSLKKIKF